MFTFLLFWVHQKRFGHSITNRPIWGHTEKNFSPILSIFGVGVALEETLTHAFFLLSDPYYGFIAVQNFGIFEYLETLNGYISATDYAISVKLVVLNG